MKTHFEVWFLGVGPMTVAVAIKPPQPPTLVLSHCIACPTPVHERCAVAFQDRASAQHMIDQTRLWRSRREHGQRPEVHAENYRIKEKVV